MSQPLLHRGSHARSCAMYIAQKFRVDRAEVIEYVRRISGIDMHAMTEDDIDRVIALLEDLRWHYPDTTTPV